MHLKEQKKLFVYVRSSYCPSIPGRGPLKSVCTQNDHDAEL